jgi:hypothetical protein
VRLSSNRANKIAIDFIWLLKIFLV